MATDNITAGGLLGEIGTLHLDRGYDSGAERDRLLARDLHQFEIQVRGTKVPASRSSRSPSGCLATTILIVGRLIDWRNRWSPTTT